MYNTYYGQNFVKKGEKLNTFIKKIKEDGRKKEYDCIIGISGGVDSSYIALLMDQFRLRALAIHLDNGWDTNTTRNNIKKIGEKLDIDIHHELLEWSEFCDSQLSFLKSSTPDSEIPTDHAIDETMYRSKKKYSIKYNINGYIIKPNHISPRCGPPAMLIGYI